MMALMAAHIVWGVALLALAAWWATMLFSIFPHLKASTLWENLAIVMTLALAQCGPLAALGIWLLSLGRAVWRGDPGLRRRLLRAHGLLLVLGLAAVYVGIADLQAAAESARRGGGLLGGIGLIPLVLGGFVAVLSAGGLAVAWWGMPPADASSRR